MSAAFRGKYGPLRLRILSIAILLALWEIAARWFIDPAFASPPSAVVTGFGHLFADPKVAGAVGSFFMELAVAFAIAVVAGLVVGLAVGATPFNYRSLFPIVLLLYAIPQVTVLPMFILFFGLGTASKIAFGASHGIFPIILNVVAGMKGVRPIHVLSARTMGASKMQIVRRVILPQLVPSLFVGMRLSMAVTLLGVVLAELYVSTTGIGYFTQLFSEKFDPTDLFCLITVLAAIAIGLNELTRRLELHFSRWRSD
jgi:ABC-type nitrate/sulfonate/bicarbonate transport system permease component